MKAATLGALTGAAGILLGFVTRTWFDAATSFSQLAHEFILITSAVAAGIAAGYLLGKTARASRADVGVFWQVAWATSLVGALFLEPRPWLSPATVPVLCAAASMISSGRR